MQLADAHRAAREDLEALLERWESMFEQAQSSTSAQNASNAGGSDGIAVIARQTPSVWSISSTWSMSSVRPSLVPGAR